MSTVELMGVPGSPYTRKTLSLLRYRRIPYRFIPSSRNFIDQNDDRYPSRPEPKVALLPTFYTRDEKGEEVAITDTSPVLRKFEQQFPDRKVIPNHPALSFINMLIEDYADEWLTKAMFHYRWSYAADIEKAAQMLPRWTNTNVEDERIAPLSQAIAERQISRLSYVGSNETTKVTIENSFIRFLEVLDKCLTVKKFILGNRASSCDFAVYGQLTCLALFDPTPQQIITERFPRIYAWTEFMEDLSGYEILEDDWLVPAKLPEAVCALLREIGELYLPYLEANAAAVVARADLVETTVDGQPWVQNPFPYQAKCLHWLRDAYTELDDEARSCVDGALPATALAVLLTE